MLRFQGWMTGACLSLAVAASASDAPAGCLEARAAANACRSEPLVRLIADEPPLAGQVWGDFFALQTCRALALGTPAQCGPLSVRPVKQPCVSFYYQGLFAKAEASGKPEAAERACEEMFAKEGGVIPAAAGARACKALVAKDVPGACASLRRDVKPTKDFSLARCDDGLRMLLGDRSLCARMRDDEKEFCFGLAALPRATEPGGAAACKREPFCRALTGAGADACAPLEARAKTKACAPGSAWMKKRACQP